MVRAQPDDRRGGGLRARGVRYVTVVQPRARRQPPRVGIRRVRGDALRLPIDGRHGRKTGEADRQWITPRRGHRPRRGRHRRVHLRRVHMRLVLLRGARRRVRQAMDGRRARGVQQDQLRRRLGLVDVHGTAPSLPDRLAGAAGHAAAHAAVERIGAGG